MTGVPLIVFLSLATKQIVSERESEAVMQLHSCKEGKKLAFSLSLSLSLSARVCRSIHLYPGNLNAATSTHSTSTGTWNTLRRTRGKEINWIDETGQAWSISKISCVCVCLPLPPSSPSLFLSLCFLVSNVTDESTTDFRSPFIHFTRRI